MRKFFASLRNVSCEPVERVSGFRKTAMGTWRDAYDPSVYGWSFIDAAPIDAYLAKRREESGEALTYTHFFAALLASFFREHPDANALLRFGRPYMRHHVTGMVQVAIPADGHHEIDLSGVTLRGLETMSLVEIARNVREQAALVRRGEDREFARAKGILQAIPFWLMFPVIQFSSMLSYTFNLRLGALGLAEDPFGTFMLTNVGSLGLDAGLAPLVPYSRCGLVFTLGKKAWRPVANERGELEAREQISVAATFDHRLYDGVHIARFHRCLAHGCAHPEEVLL